MTSSDWYVLGWLLGAWCGLSAGWLLRAHVARVLRP